MTPLDNIRRIESLERQLSDQDALVRSLLGRRGGAVDKRWVYLARTVATDGQYPATGNTFGLIFLDRNFTEAQGSQAPTDTARSNAFQQVGRTLDGSYVGANTVVAVIPTPNPDRWHILPQPSQQSVTAAYFHVDQDRNPADESFIVTYDGHFPAANPPPVLTSGSFEVWDTNFLFKRALAGGIGIALYNDAATNRQGQSQPRWDVIWCQQQCITAMATIKETYTPGQQRVGMCEEGEVEIIDFRGTSPSPFNLTPDPPPTTALNFYGHKGEADDVVHLQWDDGPEDEDWIVVDVTKKKTKLLVLPTDDAQQGGVTALKEIDAAVEYCEKPKSTKFSFFYRGKVYQNPLTKGGSGLVERFGTDSTLPSGIFDPVVNELATVGAGKVVYYAQNGSKLYVIQAECPLE